MIISENLRITGVFEKNCDNPDKLLTAVFFELAMPIIDAVTPQILAKVHSMGERVIESVKESSEYFMSFLSKIK